MIPARVCCVALLGISAFAASSPSIPKLDRVWKRYTNARRGYCVSYPKRWVRGDAYDGDGLFAATGAQKLSMPLGALDISATTESPEPSRGPALKPVSFDQDLESHLDGLKRFLRVQRTEVLEQRTFSLEGAESLFLKTRYYDPREKSSWVEELVFTRSNGTLYRMELQSRADQLSRFEPVFNRFIHSFQFSCRR